MPPSSFSLMNFILQLLHIHEKVKFLSILLYDITNAIYTTIQLPLVIGGLQYATELKSDRVTDSQTPKGPSIRVG